MKPIKINLQAAAIRTLSLACFASAPTFGGVGKTSQSGTFTAPNGNTVEVCRVQRENAAGDVSKRRGFNVTDEAGMLVRRGQDRAQINADGSRIKR